MRVVASLRAPHQRLLLRSADEQRSLAAGEPGQELLGDIVLAFLAERHQLQPAGGDETVDAGDERLGHRVHQCGRRVVVAAMTDEEPLHPAAVGQPRNPHVEIHPVDRLDVEYHVIGHDIGDTTR